MKEPYFSIIIPVYNREKFITQTVNSVLKQTFIDFEIIIVDDCSSDNSIQVIQKINDPRVLLIKQEYNQERGAARNRGFKESTGKYICFLDSDDFFEHNHLETLFKATQLENSSEKLYFTNAFMYNGKTRYKKVDPNIHDYNIFQYLLDFTFNPARACIHKNIINEFQFDTDISGLEDLDLWLRIATKYKITQLAPYTSIYNMHDEQYTTGDPQRYIKELKNFKKIFSKQELKGKLPTSSMNKRLAQSYYFISLRSKGFFSILTNSWKAFYIYPNGYNSNSNKTMFVNCIYSIPGLGQLIKSIIRLFK